jgi:phosphoglycerate dehydrogenase-like enzyme
MKKNLYLADPDIHPMVLDSLREAGLNLILSPGGATAILTQEREVGEDELEAARESLRAIFLLEPGSAKLADAAVPVYSLPNLALTGVAEHTVLLMLALAKRLPWILEKTRIKAWSPATPAPALTTQRKYAYNWVDLREFGMLAGSTVGLVGLGYIGKATARLLSAFSCKVVYYKPRRLSFDQEADLNVEWRDFEDLLRDSDYVSLHHRFFEGPDGNDKQFDDDAFRKMKKTAFFINTARGRMVDEEALCRAIESHWIAGAGLDVFRYEPLPEDHPFFRLPAEKMILTPHLGGVPVKDAAAAAASQILDILAGLT